MIQHPLHRGAVEQGAVENQVDLDVAAAFVEMRLEVEARRLRPHRQQFEAQALELQRL